MTDAMDVARRKRVSEMAVHRAAGACLAALIACAGWIALVTELAMSLERSLAHGIALPQALFMFLRYFTILTNIGVAILMTWTVVQLVGARALPRAGVYNAALAYAGVTCLTYEALLRGLWSPQGVQFYTDLTMHDLVPAATLLFWLTFAPRGDARWRDVPWLLAYPTAYFAVTLLAGALGEGYPYDFLDAGRLGYGVVSLVAAVFLAIFFALGLATTAVSRRRARSAP